MQETNRDAPMVSFYAMHPRLILSLGNFFLTVSATLVSYTLLSYLSSFIPQNYLGFTISAGALIACAAFPFLPRFVRSFGAQRLALFLGFAAMVMLFIIATSPRTIVSAFFVILVISLQPLLYYGLDLLLEATVEEEGTTGRVRTFFLTGGNTGAFVAPLLIGSLLSYGENYSHVFFAAAAALTPFIVLFSVRLLPKGELPDHSQVNDTFTYLIHNRDLAATTIGHLILYLFYIWAPLYVPIYLHVVLGIPWTTLGWVFSLMLIPYILVEYPAGWIADRFLGDKELMFAGFLIAGSALAAVSLITATSPPFEIVAILVATRFGAALIESMNEGHFFRRVSEKDIVSVSIFRGVWPLANAIAPLIGALIFLIDGYPLLFALTGGFVAIAGSIATYYIKDFR